MLSSAFLNLSGFGRYPRAQCKVFRPERMKEVVEGLSLADKVIPRGLGRAYGDAAINPHRFALLMERLDRMLAFDEQSRVLRCEGGVTLDDIIMTFLPRGYFLPVTPGTRYCTVGGCFSCDVHGKNHHKDGSFGNFIRSVRILLPNLDVVECSPTKNSELFYAALGGMGLLGVVLEVEIELMKVESSFMVVDFVRTKDLDDTLRTFHERDERYQYSVGWIDCVASGASFGRGVLMFGRHAGLQDLPAPLHENPFGAMPKGHITVPEGVPDFLLNPLTLRAFNALYYLIHPTKEGALVPLLKFFYPLDSVHEWNRFYGKQGFVQWQCVLPYEDGAKNIRFVLETLQRYRCFPYLSVLKRLGNPSGGLLSFPMPGYTLALDFPVREGLFPALDALDKMVVESGGRLYLAKDARMSKETFRATYPSWRRFAEIKRALDRTLKLESGLSRRLGLSEAQ